MHVERFAPSPTGRLHLGHAFSALTAWEAAEATGGIFRLRIEDLDIGRARPEFEDGIFEDLRWLGLRWPEPVMRQSARGAAYQDALARLGAMGLTYPCTCTRADLAAAAGAPQEGAEAGPVYPGTCRPRTGGAATPGKPAAIRLDCALAAERVRSLTFTELGAGPTGETGEIAVNAAALAALGDVVLTRKDAAAAYHLAVVVDDAAEGVTHVTRGEDLFASTPVHRLLQALLGLPAPLYRHHRLIRDAAGRRLAKRADDLSLETLREAGLTPTDIRRAVGLRR
ncbi:tRNA glutamyl-Q(34) synthetase GluQRS [Pikeienuella piscinae]|uniref:tRNA glutamyl-Q(34) synthetase GluQRS n=1 Tax=Pikeienuella piscinae TaxID=2748098 RepID=A0A7M3T6Q4_9RHOB|nr:tRNA glutamyl-Q(34) synthetase GluQRS [Pikeienuella piscinae]QIE57685.1 tRNA glutamyl-Q(34) synthetase GluQRS [Pikeienuella piscinae]